MTTGEELKKCPFCAKPAVLKIDSDHHGEYFNLGCQGEIGGESYCPGALPYYTEPIHLLDKAIEAWNRRAE